MPKRKRGLTTDEIQKVLADLEDEIFDDSDFDCELENEEDDPISAQQKILRLLNEDKMAASTSSRVCSSSMFLVKWNGIMESFLIDEVEKLLYLWNPRHPHFTKRLKKNWISADRHEDEREVAGTRSFLTPAKGRSPFLRGQDSSNRMQDYYAGKLRVVIHETP
ncbi:hypothetical protein TNCV_864801 [Trichonephila clavipes]|nr:hypothetical protein TNCV_864801 [Trichonephila clavipes]